jgi:hypothetical protein
MQPGSVKPRRRIGLDFDNTIVIYDQVFAELGQQAGLLPAGFSGNKDQARAAIRALPDGEAKWTQLQAGVYGPGIRRARLAPGLLPFLAAAHAHGYDLMIVSHKTEFAAADPDGTNLRQAARDWICAQGLAGTPAAPFQSDSIFFEGTRETKIERIAALRCDCFIDDLEEVFAEPTFPTTIERHLIKLDAEILPQGPFTAWRDWATLQRSLFGEN